MDSGFEGATYSSRTDGESISDKCRQNTPLHPRTQNQFAMLQSGRRLEREKFQNDDTWQRNAVAFPLFVFHSGFFSRPQAEYEERFSFCIRLPSGDANSPSFNLHGRWMIHAVRNRSESNDKEMDGVHCNNDVDL